MVIKNVLCTQTLVLHLMLQVLGLFHTAAGKAMVLKRCNKLSRLILIESHIDRFMIRWGWIQDIVPF